MPPSTVVSVGRHAVPRAAMRWTVSGSAQLPCSIESAPGLHDLADRPPHHVDGETAALGVDRGGDLGDELDRVAEAGVERIEVLAAGIVGDDLHPLRAVGDARAGDVDDGLGRRAVVEVGEEEVGRREERTHATTRQPPSGSASSATPGSEPASRTARTPARRWSRSALAADRVHRPGRVVERGGAKLTTSSGGGRGSRGRRREAGVADDAERPQRLRPAGSGTSAPRRRASRRA